MTEHKIRQLIALLTMSIPFFLHAQEKGIAWTKNVSWSEVKQKALKENKYIFLDCYTTWCGPCKAMDKHVFTNDTVGAYFNNHFISVKVQMDKTRNDETSIQQWYGTADTLSKRYKVAAFPTYIFLSPDGHIVHKEIGYKPVQEFVKAAETALEPGKVYNDPFAEYDNLVDQYRKGQKNYDRMLHMIEQAEKINDLQLANQLREEYKIYLLNSNAEVWCRKENISFISSFVSSESKFFEIFYPDGKKTDETMGYPGYSAKVVDRVIQREIFHQFGIKSVDLGKMWDLGNADLSETNWDAIYRTIKDRFNKEYAERNILTAKLNWYLDHDNYKRAAESYFEKLNKYGIDTIQMFPNSTTPVDHMITNGFAWQVFLHLDDKKLIKEAIKWMQNLIISDINGGYIDTYANLLYKLGKRNQAIEWQQKAIQLALTFNYQPDIDEFNEHLEKMKKGKPTWELRE
jgi:thioredoxin-related protein